MLTKLQARISAFTCLALFIVSLTLNLHGAIAVIAAFLFFVFLSASMVNRKTVFARVMRIVGWLFLAVGFINLLLPGPKNLAFVATVIACGAVLAFNQLSSWLIRSGDTE